MLRKTVSHINPFAAVAATPFNVGSFKASSLCLAQTLQQIFIRTFLKYFSSDLEPAICSYPCERKMLNSGDTSVCFLIHISSSLF